MTWGYSLLNLGYFVVQWPVVLSIRDSGAVFRVSGCC